jgi:formate C-acetyltransferase
MRMKKEHLSTMLKPLVTGFFQKDGMQLQISCLSIEEILDAMAHPENHRNLVVRIGGYSEYFNRLSPELKQSVLERTEH